MFKYVAYFLALLASFAMFSASFLAFIDTTFIMEDFHYFVFVCSGISSVFIMVIGYYLNKSTS